MTPVEQDPSAGLNGAVAGELRAMRARRSSTNEQIAVRSGISLVSVNRYMAGKRNINLAVLHAIAEALDADPELIMSAALADLVKAPARAARKPVTASKEDFALVADEDQDGPSIEDEQEGRHWT